jgi:hypothetical protein
MQDEVVAELVNSLRGPWDPANLTPFKSCLCGKMLKSSEHVKRWYSGVVNYDDVLCQDCRKTYGDMARIVCIGCKRLQGFIGPHRATTGFQFERRKHYHIGACPKCDNAAATPVLEHEQFCRTNGIATKTNLDLVQEIEQKTLQGRLAADKLRAELKLSPP